MTNLRRAAPLRGTQSLVGYMGWVSDRPSLTALEVIWRWTFGIPLLLVCWKQWQQILAAFPLESSGFNAIDAQNPWVAIVQLTNVWTFYQPHVLVVLRWLLPAAALAWVAISGIGRNLVLKRMDPRLPFRPVGMIVLQTAWLAMLAAVFWGWFRCMQWAAASHISANGEPDLVGFAIWTIILSLAFFTAWALISWALSIAPLLLLLERGSVFSSLGQSLRLGKPFTGKLAEIRRPSAVQRRVGQRRPARAVGRLHGLLSRCQRLLPRRAAQGICRVLADVSRICCPLNSYLPALCAASSCRYNLLSVPLLVATGSNVG